MDNSDAGFSVLNGVWSSGTFGQPYGDDYRWVLTTTSPSPTAVVEWRPVLPVAGWYSVQTYYVSGANRSPAAPFTVEHADGSSTVTLNQQVNGETWVSIGVYYFHPGTDGAVSLDNAAPGSVVIADAVRFEPVGEPAPTFRGLWADAFHIGFKSTSQVEALITRALQGNYNAILAEVLAYHDRGSGGHGAYWNSAIVPKAADISGSFDPLAYLVQRAHAVGLEVHAWILPYRVSTSWPPAGNDLLSANPQWFMVQRSRIGLGPSAIGGNYFLDPGSPDVQDYLIAIVEELTSQYEIDGIHWDYIRYTTEDAGYPAYTWYADSGLARFQTNTGYAGTPATDYEPWDNFRRRTITELVRRAQVAVATADSPRQPLRHSAALITWGDAPSNFESTSSWARVQDWRTWMQRGYLDTGIPMTYYRHWQYPNYYYNWVEQALLWRYDRHLVCGPGIYLNTMADSLTQLQYALDQGADGVCTYSYYATTDQDADGSWENDWSWYAFIGANLFTLPVETPAMPWRDPATATRGVIYGFVRDGATGTPIDDAVIRINGFAFGRTDANGFFALTELGAGSNGTPFPISVQVPGYEIVERPAILVERAGYTEANFGVGDWLPGDYDASGAVEYDDFARWQAAMTGPQQGPPPAGGDVFDVDLDGDVDTRDYSLIQLAIGL